MQHGRKGNTDRGYIQTKIIYFIYSLLCYTIFDNILLSYSVAI